MSPELEAPSLWLVGESTLLDHSVTRALLYPVFEYRALVFARDRSVGHLDPFEQAVFGSCRAGVFGIAEQARDLGLHRDFVAHLQSRLREMGLLDVNSRPRTDEGRATEPRTQSAICLYWDPMAQVLWPRYVKSKERRGVQVRTKDGRHFLEAGTDGDPFDIPLYRIVVTKARPPKRPSADEALSAISSWSRELRRDGGFSMRDTLNDPAVTVMDGATLVYLCAPKLRAMAPGFSVADPFGGATWQPFRRRLTRRAAEEPGLAKWLGLDREQSASPEIVTEEIPTPQFRGDAVGEVPALRERCKAYQSAGARAQLALDLVDNAHRLLDDLQNAATRPRELLPTDAGDYRPRAALMFGFDLADETRLRLSAPTVASHVADSLWGRCCLMLDLFSPDDPGPLHLVARATPHLLDHAGAFRQVRSVMPVVELFDLVQGLAAGVAAATYPDDGQFRKEEMHVS